MQSIYYNTSKSKEVIDITDLINSELKKQKFNIGLLNIFAKHTTVALTIADLDPGTDLDLLDAYSEMVPKLKYRHPHDPGHVSDHILSSMIGTSLMVPVKNGSLDLGMWQRVILVELSGPRKRELSFIFLNETQ